MGPRWCPSNDIRTLPIVGLNPKSEANWKPENHVAVAFQKHGMWMIRCRDDHNVSVFAFFSITKAKEKNNQATI